MGEETSQGITRRDLLRRGVVLGGAVVWTTPVVQTLGMGRAFASTASPVGDKDISYIGINVICADNTQSFFAKWEDGKWEESPGAAPECADKDDLPNGLDGMTKGFSITQVSPSCANVTVPDTLGDCTVDIWVKAGSSESTTSPCNKYENVSAGTHLVCTSA